MSRNTEYKASRIIYIILVILLLLIFTSPFAIPIFFSATVSMAMWPMMVILEKKGFSRKAAAATLTVVFTVIISIPLMFFIVRGTLAVTHQLEKINQEDTMIGVQGLVKDIRKEVIVKIQKYSDKFHLADYLTISKIDEHLKKLNGFLLTFFRNFAGSLPLLILLFIIMILCTYSFLKHGNHIKEFLQNLFGFSDARMGQLVNIFIDNSQQVYISNIATGAIQATCVASGAYFTGTADFFIVFFITFMLSFIPVVGAAPIAFACAFMAYVDDHHTVAIILIVIGFFTGLIDNILRPWLSTLGESKTPPIWCFVSVLGGAMLLGFPGLFIGILVGTIAYDTLPIFWEELGSDSVFKS